MYLLAYSGGWQGHVISGIVECLTSKGLRWISR
jgi:glucose-6-phosphate-specific signal transduction histidine kinase